MEKKSRVSMPPGSILFRRILAYPHPDENLSRVMIVHWRARWIPGVWVPEANLRQRATPQPAM
jgi:hypothetical protein